MKRYNEGLDVLGGDLTDILNMIPAVATVNKVMDLTDKSKKPSVPGASGGPSVEEAVKKAIEEERRRQAEEKAAAQTRTTQYLMFGLLGAVGIGGVLLILTRR